MSKQQKAWLVVGIVLLCLLIDQFIKIYIKLHFKLDEAVEVFPWFHIHFTENNGMAFGIEWISKLFLTLFRVVVSGLVIWYMIDLIKKNEVRTGYLVCMALVLAGALGNIIDCMCYGLIFSASTPDQIATFMGGGYAPMFYGRVVDMFYFPLIYNSAGEPIFFNAIFNFADSCICVAVFLIILFYSKDLNKSLNKESKKKAA